MNRTVILAVAVVVLALGAGVAFAATQSTASGGTNVCVNNTNGLVRVADTCRDGEHPLTIGGSSGQITSGTFNVAWGESGGAKVLPLTGVTVSGRCVITPPEYGGGAIARPSIEAPAGSTMDVFPGGTAQSSVLLPPVAYVYSGGAGSNNQNAILTRNAATATLNFGGKVDADSQTCTFLWQAVEAPN